MAMRIVEFLLVCLSVPEKNQLLFSKSSSLMVFHMVQEGGEIWMENYRVGEAEPLARALPDGAQSAITPASVKFFDQEAAAYFGQLEEDLVQGVEYMRETEDRNSLLWRRPPTLEIFPSWPMRESLQSARSTDSGSAQNTESHLEMESQTLGRTCSDRLADHQLSNLEDKGKMTDSSARKDGRVLDAKTLRRLAQNREAAKKSRLRKKAYVQQLEFSRIKLHQTEQELERARSQGLLAVAAGRSNEATDSVSGTAAAAFDVEYGRWQEEECRRMGELRAAVQARFPDASLGVMLDEWVAHYDKLFQLKAGVARADPIHLLNGAWRTPAERCFLWIGGFRPSELLKMVVPVVDPLTEQQVIAMYNLQLSSHQAEEALSLGLHQLQRSLAETVACGGGGAAASLSVDVGIYTSFMGIALGQLANLEGFIRQADNLRQQTLHQLRCNLTMRQATQCFLSIGEYYARLRALSSLWISRPRENLIGNDSVGSTSTGSLKIAHRSQHNHFSTY
ncbi:transcription factor TGA2.1-like isoform X6 [Zingiber officinale]|uniref:transcription factor TGA2.1-like isoform X6 n=1 Tax=Zingiber officinale TaxID=94328 RepID=UPI001C4AB5B6|nr:transcription factor TGA2.1-like isoform X6 [Zingiber officinale]